MDPAVIPLEVRLEMLKVPPALVINRACPPVLASKNNTNPPELVMMVALSAMLALKNSVSP